MGFLPHLFELSNIAHAVSSSTRPPAPPLRCKSVFSEFLSSSVTATAAAAATISADSMIQVGCRAGCSYCLLLQLLLLLATIKCQRNCFFFSLLLAKYDHKNKQQIKDTAGWLGNTDIKGQEIPDKMLLPTSSSFALI